MLSMTQATFADWREEPRNGRDENDWVLLRVGGQVFETSRLTLCADRESMLAAQVLRQWGENENNNSNSMIRIDRDGQRFAHVLNYLRNGTVWLQNTGLLRELQEEAEFYCLAGLSALCEEKIQLIGEAQEAASRKNVEILKEEVKKCEEKIQLIGEAQEAASRKNVEILKEEIKKCLGDAIPVKFSGGSEVFSVLRERPRLPCGCEQPPEFRLDADF